MEKDCDSSVGCRRRVFLVVIGMNCWARFSLGCGNVNVNNIDIESASPRNTGAKFWWSIEYLLYDQPCGMWSSYRFSES
jgi:hypothetical protein